MFNACELIGMHIIRIGAFVRTIWHIIIKHNNGIIVHEFIILMALCATARCTQCKKKIV